MTDWRIFAIGSALFAGLTAVLAKIGVEAIPSNLATLIRTAVILVFLGLWVGLRREWPSTLLLDRRSVCFLALSGIATGLSWLCYFHALQQGPVSGVATLDKLSLVVAIALAALVLREPLTGLQWAGGSLMVVGSVLMAFR